jgi:GrpB-like predicted nucleotidyltransferase (UPF0157 family)
VTEPLGLESKTVRVVPYDPRWPGLFAAEAASIAQAVERLALPPLIVEHVGSTSIPDLLAKPILDVAAARPTDTPAVIYIPAFESIGYVYRGDGGLPGREFFRRGERRSHHVHLVELAGVHWSRYLRFRDALRADPAIRDAYGALKLALAERYPRDREAYIDGKTAFVEEVLRAVSSALQDISRPEPRPPPGPAANGNIA